MLRVKKEKLEEYEQRHKEVWPDMLDALRRSVWTNYCTCYSHLYFCCPRCVVITALIVCVALFLSPEGILFGYVEIEDRFFHLFTLFSLFFTLLPLTSPLTSPSFISLQSLFFVFKKIANSLEDANKRMAKEEVNKKWQDSMAPFFETDGQHADKSFQVLKHVFYLP